MSGTPIESKVYNKFRPVLKGDDRSSVIESLERKQKQLRDITVLLKSIDPSVNKSKCSEVYGWFANSTSILLEPMDGNCNIVFRGKGKKLIGTYACSKSFENVKKYMLIIGLFKQLPQTGDKIVFSITSE